MGPWSSSLLGNLFIGVLITWDLDLARPQGIQCMTAAFNGPFDKILPTIRSNNQSASISMKHFATGTKGASACWRARAD